jgi:hypothetical protein
MQNLLSNLDFNVGRGKIKSELFVLQSIYKYLYTSLSLKLILNCIIAESGKPWSYKNITMNLLSTFYCQLS